jgi:hypothetical protein
VGFSSRCTVAQDSAVVKQFFEKKEINISSPRFAVVIKKRIINLNQVFNTAPFFSAHKMP